jgi:hypothetical protein
MAEHELTEVLNGRMDTDRYVAETEQIRHQMELKRADMARLGKLPRETHAPAIQVRTLHDPSGLTKQAHDPGAGPFPHGYGQP